jgi:hypothetical protein
MKLFGTGDTPFQPANPSLDIPDGDPRELNTITNQALNNIYGELYGAIQGSGQELTAVNGTNPDLTQLSNAIGTQSIGGEVYIDAGGSTANVKNVISAQGYVQDIKVGSIITFQSTINSTGAVTLNVYSAPGVLQLSAPVTSATNPLTSFNNLAGTGSTGIQSNTMYTCVYNGTSFELLYIPGIAESNIRPRDTFTIFNSAAGNRFRIVTVPYASQTLSTTSWNVVALPRSFSQITSIVISPSQSTFSTTLYSANYLAVTSGNSISFLSYGAPSGSPAAPIPFGQGIITVMGYS